MCHTTTATGRRIFFDDLGSGPPLVLIPGQSADRRGGLSWLASALMGRFRVISIDNRDSGESDPESDYYTIHDMAGDVADLLDALEIERTHVLGHSLGASVATQFALGHADRGHRLVLVCGGAGWPPAHRPGEPLPAPDDWWSDDPVERTRRLIPFLIGSYARNRIGEADVDALAALEPSNRATWAGNMRQEASIVGFDLWSRLPEVRASTLVIRGEEDHPERGGAIAAAIPEARLLVIPGTGHIPWIERPEAVIPTIADFLIEPTPQLTGGTHA